MKVFVFFSLFDSILCTFLKTIEQIGLRICHIRVRDCFYKRILVAFRHFYACSLQIRRLGANMAAVSRVSRLLPSIGKLMRRGYATDASEMKFTFACPAAVRSFIKLLSSTTVSISCLEVCTALVYKNTQYIFIAKIARLLLQVEL